MRTKLILLFPVYNDWVSFEKLLKEIEEILPDNTIAGVVAVNDCSDSSLPETCFYDYEFKKIKSIRGHRYSGYSKLNFISLIVHGLGNISVFSDIVFSRLLIAMSSVSSLSFFYSCSFSNSIIHGTCHSRLGI